MSDQPSGQSRILIVDDHEENLLALEAVLTEPHYELVRAISGRDALREALRGDFAVILLDVAMPGMDGYETAALMRERERSRDTPIIFLTANNRSDTHIFRGYSVGAVDYIFKPFSPDVLKSKVSVFVELFQKREALKWQTAALQRAHDELEERVRERTAALAAANEVERDLRTQAEQVNRLKDEFLATLSHELRTPLNAILGWTHLLALPTDDPKMTERAVTVIKNNAVAQSQIIEDILDVSRIIGGKLRLRLVSVSLREVVSTAIEAIVPAAAAKGITVNCQLEESDPIVVDRDRIQQVCWNLVSNAVKFTPKGGEVNVSLTTQGDDQVLTVRDNGIGITPEFLPYIFDRFSQADGSANRRHGGLGLGMAIVRHLIELHGGTVRADSDGPNTGATFTICIPRRAVQPGEDYTSASGSAERVAASHEPQSLPSLAGQHVLLVDDEADQREFLGLLLRQSGADVSLAASGATALELIRGGTVTAVVSDLDMPGMDGLALMRQVRADGLTALPAIALTSHVRTNEAGAALDAGFDLHVGKPVDIAQLITAIDALSDVRTKS
ncbi:MAG TPA: response regulator [Vicinamibacterales bacterium]|nr:response regulator [Vicinamibacterales bacterium]